MLNLVTGQGFSTSQLPVRGTHKGTETSVSAEGVAAAQEAQLLR